MAGERRGTSRKYQSKVAMSSLTPTPEGGDQVCPHIPRDPLKAHADTDPHMWHMWTNHPLSKFSEPKGSLLRGLVSGDLAWAHAEGLGQGAHF